MTSKHDEQIVAKIIEQIEQNKVLPWQCGYLKEGLPRNFVTGRGYHGRNLLMLFCANYNRSGFMTYAQAKKLGGQVRKGEHGFPIVYAESGRYIENEEGKKEWKHGCRYLIQTPLPSVADILNTLRQAPCYNERWNYSH